MDYKEPSENLSEDSDASGEIPLDLDEELDFREDPSFTEDPALADLDQLGKKGKNQAGNRYSLRARRAIEDHLEQRRLRKELDYLFDDHFTEGEEEDKKE